MRTPSLEFMNTGNVRAYTETDGRHDKGVWDEWQLKEYTAKTRNIWKMENADIETARHCKELYECNRSVPTCCHIIHNTEHVDQGEKPETITSVPKRWPQPTGDPCWSESLTGGGGGGGAANKRNQKPTIGIPYKLILKKKARFMFYYGPKHSLYVPYHISEER